MIAFDGCRGKAGTTAATEALPPRATPYRDPMKRQRTSLWTAPIGGIQVAYGDGSLERLAELVTELGGGRVLIVTDPGVRSAGHVERAERTMRPAADEIFVFDDVEENPTTEHVDAGTAFAARLSVDLLVGLGGGSAMDCAKGINFLLSNGGVMEDYWGLGKATKPMLPSIGVPTTAGTGSEAQSYALIAQKDTHRKMACGDPAARFRSPATTLRRLQALEETDGG